MLPFKGRSYLRQYFPKKLRKWEFRIWRRSGFSGFLYEFDVYRGHSNKTNSTFGVSGLVAMLCSTLPKQENHKVLLKTLFTSLPSLIEHLKSNSIWYTGTIQASCLKNCPLLAKKT